MKKTALIIVIICLCCLVLSSCSLKSSNAEAYWAVASMGDLLYADDMLFYSNDEFGIENNDSGIVEINGNEAKTLLQGENDEEYYCFNYLDGNLYYCSYADSESGIWKYSLAEKTTEMLYSPQDKYISFLWVNKDYYLFADNEAIYKAYFDGTTEQIFNVSTMGYGAVLRVESADENGLNGDVCVQNLNDESYADIRFDFDTETYKIIERKSSTGELTSWYKTDANTDYIRHYNRFTYRQNDEKSDFFFDETHIYSYENGCEILGDYDDKLWFYSVDINHNMNEILVLSEDGEVEILDYEKTGIRYFPQLMQSDGYIISANFDDYTATSAFTVYDVNSQGYYNLGDFGEDRFSDSEDDDNTDFKDFDDFENENDNDISTNGNYYLMGTKRRVKRFNFDNYEENCDWCSGTPTCTFYNPDAYENEQYAYICEDCASKCYFCNATPKYYYQNIIGSVVFVCEDCYDESLGAE